MNHIIKKPYLLLLGDIENPASAKTAFGLCAWTPEACLGQMRFHNKAVDVKLPDMSLQEAVAAGAKTLVIGIAPHGGRLPESWQKTLIDALQAGLDLAAGLHQRLESIPAIADCARALGRKIHDVRHSSVPFDGGTGIRRPGRRLLTVGTDCVLGKKYTALAIAKAMAAAGRRVDFRATGQTGILIAGGGVAVDAVVSDFVAGAAESLSPANTPDHWDIIEGQGSLFHPGYAGVTLGLLHGSQPDALVLCHDPTRTTILGYPHVPIRRPEDAIEPYLAAARLTNPNVRFIGAALNTSGLSEANARSVLQKTADTLNLPCVDPIRTGVDPLVKALESFDAS